MLKILEYPNDVLLEDAESIKEITEEIKTLAKDMIEAMHTAHGVGLAAPQVGVSKQLIVVNPTGEPGNEKVYINPKILKRKGRVMGEEGCLSFPGVFGNVMRASTITVKAMLLTGEEVTFESTDFEARVIQHEIDHLYGILFVTKVQPAEQVAFKQEMRQRELLVASRR